MSPVDSTKMHSHRESIQNRITRGCHTLLRDARVYVISQADSQDVILLVPTTKY